MTRTASCRSCQIIQQRPRIPQIRAVEALAEPAVYRREEIVPRRSLALPLPELRQDQGCPQFQRFGPLASSDLYGAAKARLSIPRRRPLEQQFTVHPMDLGREKPFVERAIMLRGDLDPIEARRDAARLRTRLR